MIDGIQNSLRALGVYLSELPSTPTVREMRTKLRGYETVVRAWETTAPSQEDATDMIECLAQLEEQAGLRRSTRPPPRGSTRPPPPKAQVD